MNWYVVLVTGSRDMSRDSAEAVTRVLRKHIQVAHEADMEAICVHGACPHPVDTARTRIRARYSADMVADGLEWDQVIAMPMPRNTHDGKPRNGRMVKLVATLWMLPGPNSAVCCAFPPKGRARSGTRNCMRLATEECIHVESLEVE